MPPAAGRPILPIFRRPRFLDDLTEAYAYLAERNPASAQRLLDEVEAIAELMAAFPEAGRAREELRPGVRSFRVRRFRHIVFYRHTGDRIILLRIRHGARNIRPNLVDP
jgi:toxin ParE1/3/4